MRKKNRDFESECLTTPLECRRTDTVASECPVTMFGDNNSVILNTTIPSSILKKKHNAIAYHRVREAIAARIVRFIHTPSESNYSDVL